MRPFAVIAILLPVFAFALGACEDDSANESGAVDYRLEMRNFVVNIGTYARSITPGFLLIPQNGHDVVTETSDPSETPDAGYLAAIDGLGREDLYYGYDADNEATPSATTSEIIAFLELYEQNGVQVLVTDYIASQPGIDTSYGSNEAGGFISFAADARELDRIPADPDPLAPYNYTAAADVASLAAARNFLYVLNPGGFAGKAAYLQALRDTNHDVLIIDAFDESETLLTAAEVASLKTKTDGAARLVIAYMSIGEAEDNRYYWQAEWAGAPPDWLAAENPNFPGNFKVRYWLTEWQNLIFGSEGTYLQMILAAGFDGVYLDIIDAFEFFETL